MRLRMRLQERHIASFEPALDYCVVKIPRLPFDKFISCLSVHLTTQMKATGEVMSISALTLKVVS